MTDRASIYYLFTYTCGGIEWSSIGEEHAVVGYNAQSDYVFNHPASGYISVGHAISCLDSRKKRQEEWRKSTISGMVESNENLMRASHLCMVAYDQDVDDISDEKLSDEIITEVEACPCTSQQASLDSRFQRQSSNGNCYTQIMPIRVPTPAREFTFVQQCCYDPQST